MKLEELKNKEEKFFSERGFGKTMGFGKTPAVLVIDMIKAFTNYTNPDMKLSANLDKEIEEINKILQKSYLNNIPVIFTTVQYDDKGFLDAGIWALKQTGLSTLRSGTPEVKIDNRLLFPEEKTILSKKYASAFFGTDLVSRLMSQHIDTLIITGCTTSGCVRATAVDALSYGFRPMVVREAVGDRSQQAHEQSLFDLQAKYADVISTQEALSHLEKINK